MKKYTSLLFDLDDTILDFQKAEKYAICKLMEHYGIEASEKNIETYHQINISYWKKLELGLVEREKLILLRFVDFFSLFDKFIDLEKAKEVNTVYFDYLSSVHRCSSSICCNAGGSRIRKKCHIAFSENCNMTVRIVNRLLLSFKIKVN